MIVVIHKRFSPFFAFFDVPLPKAFDFFAFLYYTTDKNTRLKETIFIMKKATLIVFVVIVAVLGVILLTSCNNSTTTVKQRWADAESVSFNVYEGDLQVGNATFTTTTKLTDEEKQAVSGADTRVTVSSELNGTVTESVYYAHVYNILTVRKTFTNPSDPTQNYILEGEHDGKNFVYSLTYPNATDKNKSGKLNVGSSGYTDGEFLYMYVRCYETSALPSSIKVADPFHDEVITLSTALRSSNATVKTDSSLHSVVCNEIAINRSGTPTGSGILAYYLPDSAGTYGSGTIIKSSCFPVKIVENNLTYVLSAFEPSQKNPK